MMGIVPIEKPTYDFPIHDIWGVWGPTILEIDAAAKSRIIRPLFNIESPIFTRISLST